MATQKKSLKNLGYLFPPCGINSEIFQKKFKNHKQNEKAFHRSGCSQPGFCSL